MWCRLAARRPVSGTSPKAVLARWRRFGPDTPPPKSGVKAVSSSAGYSVGCAAPRNCPASELLWKRLSVGPDGAAFEMLLLPDRHGVLQGINQPSAGVESGRAMCRGDDDQHTRFADFQPPQPVHNRDLSNCKLRARLHRQAFQLFQCHFLVSFVFEK